MEDDLEFVFGRLGRVARELVREHAIFKPAIFFDKVG